tara:strand:+ start:6612 stop:7895 length:1284 start_codon:yes stop_codon:yes gene_type:complete
MKTLQSVLEKIIPDQKLAVNQLLDEMGNKKISDVTVQQAFTGMRGVKGFICDTSSVSADKGLVVRGKPIIELTDLLPEETFYFLCTGELPGEEALNDLQSQFNEKMVVPDYVWDVVRAMPSDSHPMAMFNTAILVMEKESEFRRHYENGIRRRDYWRYTLTDAINLLAKLPAVGAGIYRIRFDKGDLIEPNPDLDWGANFAYMTGLPDPNGEYSKLMRLYFTLHCDHEGGNVSAFSSLTVASALSDLYYAISAGLNGLAGPLHGLANQESLKFILKVMEKFGGIPEKGELKNYIFDCIHSGKVVPGYGHAVLRCVDPRFTAFYEFGEKYCGDDPAYKTVEIMSKVVPEVLKEEGKAKNPWPNVDAISGAMLHSFGMTEFSFYTVLFSISRVMGISAQIILNRALGIPLMRPKSVTTDWIKSFSNDNP